MNLEKKSEKTKRITPGKSFTKANIMFPSVKGKSETLKNVYLTNTRSTFASNHNKLSVKR